jgi:hypothetical protein
MVMMAMIVRMTMGMRMLVTASGRQTMIVMVHGRQPVQTLAEQSHNAIRRQQATRQDSSNCQSHSHKYNADTTVESSDA